MQYWMFLNVGKLQSLSNVTCVFEKLLLLENLDMPACWDLVILMIDRSYDTWLSFTCTLGSLLGSIWLIHGLFLLSLAPFLHAIEGFGWAELSVCVNCPSITSSTNCLVFLTSRLCDFGLQWWHPCARCVKGSFYQNSSGPCRWNVALFIGRNLEFGFWNAKCKRCRRLTHQT